VVEVQVVGSAAPDTFAAVTLPDLELYGSRDNSTRSRAIRYRCGQVLFTLHGFKAELEDEPLLVTFRPRVNQVEDSVVAPDSWFDLS
jgi:hypothetical protein